jgi:hypothetical protein
VLKLEKDIYSGIINHALVKLIKSIDDNDEELALVKETAIRAKEVVNHIKINGADIIGLTFDEFTENIKNKPNIYLFSDEEVKELRKLQLLQATLTSVGLKLDTRNEDIP